MFVLFQGAGMQICKCTLLCREMRQSKKEDGFAEQSASIF